MSRVRLVSGKFGGRFIATPPGNSTYPMSERARSAIFNMLGSEVVDSKVLDAFAGSGAVGLEALSRGAGHATFIEKHRVASKIISENINLLGAGSSSKVIATSVNNWLETADSPKFDIIFADPPYHDPQFSTVTRLFAHLKPGALMVLSHPGRGEAPTGTKGIVVVDNRSYGTASLTFFRREL